jgi:hypothetical protein
LSDGRGSTTNAISMAGAAQKMDAHATAIGSGMERLARRL